MGFRNVVGMNGSEFIFLDLIFKIVKEVVGRNFGSSRKSVILQFIFVVGENSSIKFCTTDGDIKFVDGHSVPQVEKIVRIGMEGNGIARVSLQSNFSEIVDVKNFAARAVANADAFIIFQTNNSVADGNLDVALGRIFNVAVGDVKGSSVR